MVDFEMGQNDLLPVFAFTLTQNGAAVDLTGSTLMFHMRPQAAGAAVKVSAAAVITGALTGQGEYRWIDGDTDTPGTFVAEVEVTFPSGKPQTFPRDTKTIIKIYGEIVD